MLDRLFQRRMPAAIGFSALAGILWLATPNTVRASAVYHHRSLTEECLAEMGWGDPRAIEVVAHCNVATDFARLPGYSRAALSVALPATSEFVPIVSRLAETAPFSERSSVGFHFNSLYRFDDIAREWSDLDLWVGDVCEWLVAEPDPDARARTYLAMLGLVTHMVQDFYAHSNWVGILEGYVSSENQANDYPIWAELLDENSRWRDQRPEFPASDALFHMRRSNESRSADEHEGGLQTGSIRGERFEASPHPWKHRHHGGDRQQVIHALAVRETRHWVEKIDRRLAQLEGGGHFETEGVAE